MTIRNFSRIVGTALAGAASSPKFLIAAIVVAATIGACSGQQPPEPSIAAQAVTSSDPAKRWLGKGVDEIERELGPPTEVITLQEVRGGGGKMFLYANPGQPHMIFETDPGSQTIDKAETIK